MALCDGGAFPARASEPARPAREEAPVRFALSKRLFAEVNETDARAAVKIWAQTIAGDNGIPMDASPPVMDGSNAIAGALLKSQVDVLAMPTDEYLALEELGLAGPFLLSVANELVTEEYVLLVRAGSPLQSPVDLKGRSVTILSGPRASLAGVWLDVLCRENGLGPAGQTLARLTPVANATRVVLPVFFGKADACVVTRSGWNVMGELNPQVLKQLRVLAASPPVVPVVTCFRRGFSEQGKTRVLEAALAAYDKSAFKQLMVMFKAQRLTQRPLACLDGARALMAVHRRLCSLPSGAPPPGTGGNPAREGGANPDPAP